MCLYSSYLTVIEECHPICSFLVRNCPDFPDLEQVVPSSIADAVRKEICNNSEEETAHVSVSLPGLFGLTIIKTSECLLRSRVYSDLSLVHLNKKKQRHWMGTRENKNAKIAKLRNPRKFKPAKIRARTVYKNPCVRLIYKFRTNGVKFEIKIMHA